MKNVVIYSKGRSTSSMHALLSFLQNTGSGEIGIKLDTSMREKNNPLSLSMRHPLPGKQYIYITMRCRSTIFLLFF